MMKIEPCMACRERASVTITEDGYTPLCEVCIERQGRPMAIGDKAVCHVGSLHGTIVQFEDGSWTDSTLAEIACSDGGTVWLPLAELIPAS